MASPSLATAPQGESTVAHLRAMRTDMIGYLEHLAAQGDFLRIPAGLHAAYFVNHPDLVRQVMTTQANTFHKPSNVKLVARHLFGHNLFTSDGDLWHKLRSTMSTAFQPHRVNAYADIMVHYTNEMLDAWKVSPWTLHRHPQFFDAPECFDPERFRAERYSTIPKCAYIPFGTGPRVCLGSAFAMVQIRLNLVTILHRFRLSRMPGHTLEPFYRFNTRPKGGLPMALHQRRAR
jgi:cytochrome P450